MLCSSNCGHWLRTKWRILTSCSRRLTDWTVIRMSFNKQKSTTLRKKSNNSKVQKSDWWKTCELSEIWDFAMNSSSEGSSTRSKRCEHSSKLFKHTRESVFRLCLKGWENPSIHQWTNSRQLEITTQHQRPSHSAKFTESLCLLSSKPCLSQAMKLSLMTRKPTGTLATSAWKAWQTLLKQHSLPPRPYDKNSKKFAEADRHLQPATLFKIAHKLLE